jgi:hypothetical protein
MILASTSHHTREETLRNRERKSRKTKSTHKRKKETEKTDKRGNTNKDKLHQCCTKVILSIRAQKNHQYSFRIPGTTISDASLQGKHLI